MKKLNTYSLVTASMLAFSGCGGSKPKTPIKVTKPAFQAENKKTVNYPVIYNKYRKNGEFTFGKPAVTCVSVKPKKDYYWIGGSFLRSRNHMGIDYTSEPKITYNLTDKQKKLFENIFTASSSAKWTFGDNPTLSAYGRKDWNTIGCKANMKHDSLKYSLVCDKEEKEVLQIMKDVMKTYIADLNFYDLNNQGNLKQAYCIYHSFPDDAININLFDRNMLFKKIKSEVTLKKLWSKRMKIKNQFAEQLAKKYDTKTARKVDQREVGLFMRNPYLKESGKYIIQYMFVPSYKKTSDSVGSENLYAKKYPEKILKLSYYCDSNNKKGCQEETKKAREFDNYLLFNEKGFKPDVIELYQVDYNDDDYSGLVQYPISSDNVLFSNNNQKIDRKPEITKLLAFKTQDLKFDRTDLELKILKAKKEVLDKKKKEQEAALIKKQKEQERLEAEKRAARKAAYAKRKEAYMKKKKAAEEAKRKQEEIERLKQEVGE